MFSSYSRSSWSWFASLFYTYTYEGGLELLNKLFFKPTLQTGVKLTSHNYFRVYNFISHKEKIKNLFSTLKIFLFNKIRVKVKNIDVFGASLI